MAAVMLGIFPEGSTVRINHAGHPDDGALIVVGRNNGAVGGLGGGGAVWATLATLPTAHLILSRYTFASPATAEEIRHAAHAHRP